MCKNKEEKTHIYRTYIMSHTIQWNIQRTILTSIIRTMEMVLYQSFGNGMWQNSENGMQQSFVNGMQHQYPAYHTVPQNTPPRHQNIIQCNCVSSPTISL